MNTFIRFFRRSFAQSVSALAVVLFIFVVNIPSVGQEKITGVIAEMGNLSPINTATVFINGTTNGTITNDDGFFELKNLHFPCKLIISHVSYETVNIDLNQMPTDIIKVQMKPRKVSLPEFTIMDKNLRERNLNQFRKMFIGDDYWGNHAKLMNDSVLFFSPIYKEEIIEVNEKVMHNYKKGLISHIVRWAPDSSYLVTKKLKELDVSASAPLVVEKPLLGYTVHVNLIHFRVQYFDIATQYDYLGYYYFKPYETDKKRDIRKFDRNRREAYYNSSMHFCRSLFLHSLADNGYQLYDYDAFKKQGRKEPANLDTCMNYIDANHLQIFDLQDKRFLIGYVDGPMEGGKSFSKSILYFLSDSCTVRRDGTFPDNTIMFGGAISKKQVGASLPEDYQIPQRN